MRRPALLKILNPASRETLEDYLDYADLALDCFGYASMDKSDLDRLRGTIYGHLEFMLEMAVGYRWRIVNGMLVFAIFREGEKSVNILEFGVTTDDDVKAILREERHRTKVAAGA